jgi:hypothetical protein
MLSQSGSFRLLTNMSERKARPKRFSIHYAVSKAQSLLCSPLSDSCEKLRIRSAYGQYHPLGGTSSNTLNHLHGTTAVALPRCAADQSKATELFAHGKDGLQSMLSTDSCGYRHSMRATRGHVAEGPTRC